MGSTYNVYLGIYIKAKIQYKDVEYHIRKCVKCNNTKTSDIKFCSDCGTAIINAKENDTVQIDVDDFLEEFPEFDDMEYEFFWPDISLENDSTDQWEFLIPNIDLNNCYFFDQYDRNYDPLDLHDLSIQNIIDDYKNNNEDYIKFLDKFYGTDYEIKYGVLQYWN